MCVVSFQTSVSSPAWPPLSATRYQRAPERGDGRRGRLPVARGDPVAADGLWVQPTPPQREPVTHRTALGIHHESLPLAALHIQLVSRSPSCRQSVTVTSSARQQPNVTTPAPAADPAFSGKGSAVGPPARTHAGALSARGWRAQVTSPTRRTTYELVFQTQNQPTAETLKPVPRRQR